MTLVVHKNARCLNYLIKDNIVEVARFNQIFYYYISYISPKYDEAGSPNEYLTVMGRDAARILYERIIERPAAADFHSVTDKVDNCMKDFVRKQLVTGEVVDGNRAWPNFTCEADDSEHADTETFEATYKDNLGALLESIAAAYSVDFWVENDGPVTYIFRTQYPRRGTDKSSQVVFSIARHNILTFEHWEDAGEEKTLVYVAGAGEAQNQIIEKYPAAEPTGADRKEAYVAATYIEVAAQLEVYGDAFLDTFGQAATGVSFKFYETESCKWGIDFEIGDLVTVWDPEFDKTEQIKVEEITVRIDAQGREILEIRVGPAKPSAWDMLLAQRRLEPQDRLAIEHDHSGAIEGPKIDPDDLDPPLPGSLPYVIPAILLSTAAAEGVADSVIRSDSTLVAFDATVPNTIEPDDAAATGSIDYAARRDHEHAIVCATVGNIAPDDTAAEGTATSFARSDHTHGFTCATPTDIGSANAEGAGTEFVRDNHVHQGVHSIQKALAGALYGDVTLSEGTGISLTQAAQDIEIAVSAAVTLFAFKTINCPAGTDPVAEAPDDTLNLVAGTGISITGTAATDTVTIAVTGVSLFAFKTINCPAGTDPVADATDDTLNLTAGSAITITGTAATDTVDIAFSYTVGNASGNVPISDGNRCVNLNADLLDGLHIGHSANQIPINDTVKCDDLNADLLDGYHASLGSTAETIVLRAAAGAYIQVGALRIVTTEVIDVNRNLVNINNASPNNVANYFVTRSAGGHIDCGQYWLNGTVVINVGRNVQNMVSCNLVAHGGYGLPWVRVPTSQGVRRLTAIESPVFLFQDVADEIDPLLEEISEGEIWVAPLFRAIDGETPEWQKLSRREPDKWLVLTQRAGYAGIRFQEAPPVSEEKKPESPYWEVEDIKKNRTNCNGCKTIRQ